VQRLLNPGLSHLHQKTNYILVLRNFSAAIVFLNSRITHWNLCDDDDSYIFTHLITPDYGIMCDLGSSVTIVIRLRARRPEFREWISGVCRCTATGQASGMYSGYQRLWRSFQCRNLGRTVPVIHVLFYDSLVNTGHRRLKGNVLLVLATKSYRGSRDIAPRILKLGVRRRWLVNISPVAWPVGKNPDDPLNKKQGRHRSWYRRFGGEKIFYPYRESNLDPSNT